MEKKSKTRMRKEEAKRKKRIKAASANRQNACSSDAEHLIDKKKARRLTKRDKNSLRISESIREQASSNDSIRRQC